jgi:hypothetical protein
MDVIGWLKALDPFLVSLAFLGILWLVYSLWTRQPRIWHVAVGTDGQYSTSKFQVFVWTVIVVFAFVAMFWARWRVDRSDEQLSDIPSNVLLALGFVLVSGVASYSITSTKVAEGQDVKLAAGATRPRFASLVEEDRGVPSLHKIQLLAWTAVALASYLLATASAVSATGATGELPPLPDIDAALMVLMGLGQGVYLGRKLVVKQSTGITHLDKTSAAPGEEVVAFGVGFGQRNDQSAVELNEVPIAAEDIVRWQETRVTFTVPAESPTQAAWLKPSQEVRVNVRVNGQPGATAAPLTVTPP